MEGNRECVHYLDFSCTSVDISGKAGQTINGSFAILATDNNAEGKICSSDIRMQLSVSEFKGKHVAIEYCFDAATVEAGEIIKGEFVVISNYGEYTIPFVVNIQTPQLDSSLGKIKNLFHFTNLAQSDWDEAVEMFYSEDFKLMFQENETDSYMSYVGFSRFKGNEQNVEEFLISVNKKLPISYQFDIEGFILEDILDSTTRTIIITKSTWGYTNLKIETDAEFIRVPVEKLTTDSFINYVCSLSFEIDASMLHKGMNSGNIILHDACKKYIIPVDILMENEPEKLSKSRYVKNAVASICRNYIDMRYQRQTTERWTDNTTKTIEKLTEIDEDNLLLKLYQIQMLIRKERFNEAKWALDNLENEVFNVSDDIVAGCYYLYLTTLFNPEESYIQEICDEVTAAYANNPSKWLLALILMNLQEEYLRSDEHKWRFLENVYNNGCRSPIVLCEAVLLLQNKPIFLLKLDEFEESVLWQAAKNRMLQPDLIEQVQYLVARKKEYSTLLFRILCEIYKINKSPQTVAAICNMLIMGEKKGPDYFYWYALGVEHAVRVTKLYEYYMMSLELDRYGNVKGELDEIPKMVLMYFAYQSSLDYERNAFLYSYIIKNKDRHPDLEYSYRIAIEKFVIDQIKCGHINENLAFLYKTMLVPQMIIDDTAYAFSTLLFMHRIYVHNADVKSIVVMHEKVYGESTYPVENNMCMIPIYGNEYKLFLQDAHGNRFTKSIEFENIQLMEPEQFLSSINPYMRGRLSFDIYLCELEKNYIVINLENMKRYKNLAESMQVVESFKKEIRTKLLKFYYDNDMIGELDTFLEEIETDEMEPLERAEFIRYLVSRGMFDKAYSWISYYGFVSVNYKSLARLISKCIVTKKYVYEEFLVNVAYHIYINAKYDEIILTYLMMYYEGKVSDLRKIWKSAVELELDTQNVIHRMLMQIRYTGVVLPEKDMLLLEYTNYDDYDNVLVREILCDTAYEYFVHDAIVDYNIFDKLYEEYSQYGMNDMVCKLALLKYWSEAPDILETIPGDTVNILVKEFLHEEIYFPFYKKLTHVVPELHYFSSRFFVEHRTAPGIKVTIHYIYDNLLENTENDDNNDINDNYDIMEMKEMFDGIYVTSFLIFHGEALQYYVTEAYVSENGEAQENLVMSDILFGDMQDSEKWDLDNTIVDDRYTMLNDIMTSIDMQDELTAEQMMEEYLYKDFCARELFRIL